MILWDVFLLSCFVLGQVNCFRSTVEFDLPSDYGNAYIGQLYKHESAVQLIPNLKARVITETGTPGKICGFNIISKDGSNFPFEVLLFDSVAGTGEIRVRNDVPLDFSHNRMYTFQIAAKDCEDPPNFSERVFVNVNIRPTEQLRFTKSVYDFSTVAYSSVGEICGKVTVLHESNTLGLGNSDQCGYSMPSSEIIPFTVDQHGVIRTRDILTSRSPRFYRFRVQYKDCGISRPEVVAATVNVQVIEKECQQGWKGLPQSVEYSSFENLPKRLLWPRTYQLEMCGMTCPEDPRIVARLALLHGRSDQTLNAARPSFCRHDLRSLSDQRRLCDVEEATLDDLLPDPNRDIYKQHIAPAIGAFPTVVPLTSAFRFSSEAMTGWRLDTAKLVKAAAAVKLRLGFDSASQVTPQNLFERDFTLNFWLRRQPNAGGNDDHETVLCSQEDSTSVGHALWISLKQCRVMVQMTTGDPSTNHPESRKLFRTYFFPQLPTKICDRQQKQPDWHHYSISVTPDLETADLTASTLLVDGELVGNLEPLDQPIPIKRPTQETFPQYITVGTCYDPSVPGALQSLNGEIAGFTLLLGTLEDQSVSRCLAECGETLLIPRANRLITDDVNVLLNTDSITIESVTSSEAAELLSNIAYMKPESTSTQLTFEPTGSNLRVLELSTIFRCGNRQMGNISTSRVILNLQNTLGVETIEIPDTASSMWAPQNEVDIPTAPSTALRHPSALRLAVAGQDTVRATIPILAPGIPLFRGLTFTFSNAPSSHNAIARSASMFVLDQCLVLPSNGGRQGLQDSDPISWSVGRAFDLGITVTQTPDGVLLKGPQTAKEYASVLHSLHYWPPEVIETTVDDRQFASGILLEKRFQLICSYDGAGDSTDPFTVTIQLSSPIVQPQIRNGEKVVFSDSSAANRPNSQPRENEYLDAGVEFDDDDDDDEFYDEDLDNVMLDNDPRDQLPETRQSPPLPPPTQQQQIPQTKNKKNPGQRLNPSPQYQDAYEDGGIHYAQSNQEIRSVESLKLHEPKGGLQNASDSKAHSNKGIAIGVSLAATAVIVVVAVLVLLARRAHLRGREFNWFGRGRMSDRKSPRLPYRPETSLNVIENPIDIHEGGRLNWRPAIVAPNPTMSLGTPTIHGAYGDRDEQFDAETRSFNGLFEDDDYGNAVGVGGHHLGDSGEVGAALEEVDDFDESEAGPTHSHMDARVVGGLGVAYEEDEAASDQDDDDTSFSMGPNHLEFVTLPQPRRDYNVDVSNI